MRLWSLHPKYLDAKGLVALWREALLAQKVLQAKTKGYRHHPQLIPLKAMGIFLQEIVNEALERGYQFQAGKIVKKSKSPGAPIKVTRGQMQYEWNHLLKKLKVRDPLKYKQLKSLKKFLPHALFKIIPGKIEPWEII